MRKLERNIFIFFPGQSTVKPEQSTNENDLLSKKSGGLVLYDNSLLILVSSLLTSKQGLLCVY